MGNKSQRGERGNMKLTDNPDLKREGTKEYEDINTCLEIEQLECLNLALKRQLEINEQRIRTLRLKLYPVVIHENKESVNG